MLHGTAATVVLLRDAPGGLQVLLLERPRGRGSFAGAWVFPGGRVDPGDYGLPADSAQPTAHDDGELAAALRAGVRETAEETGLHLAEPGLVRLSCWEPPPEAPRRYRTWFFLAEAPEGEILLSPEEHVDAVWLTPAEAFGRQREGSMELYPPTWVTLYGLLGVETVAAALAAAGAASPQTYTTRQLPGRVPPVMVWHGDADYPEGAGGNEPPGPDSGGTDSVRRHRLVLNGNGWSYERTP
ncbi:NUDIX domain-containing protein [Arthrobacter sp. ATA002]|uniref:NUDIX hydrolase n=1 Tax=Arthrobacter sp. ATA002 TaxID=2991715 RepID=UPI0022A70E09|nr:NUDIX domain-containing protein [Arthrobacter sp. ATA002]WAP52230.1 NUDIX domain-containing protein [Arthrobacter sp. ATA002]